MRPASPYYKHPHAQLMRKAKRYVENWDNMSPKILKAVILNLVTALEKQPEELVIAHETITRLNRRCQEAEADLEPVPEPTPVMWSGNSAPECRHEWIGGESSDNIFCRFCFKSRPSPLPGGEKP